MRVIRFVTRGSEREVSSVTIVGGFARDRSQILSDRQSALFPYGEVYNIRIFTYTRRYFHRSALLYDFGISVTDSVTIHGLGGARLPLNPCQSTS
jgi:hypothetical protein